MKFWGSVTLSPAAVASELLSFNENSLYYTNFHKKALAIITQVNLASQYTIYLFHVGEAGRPLPKTRG